MKNNMQRKEKTYVREHVNKEVRKELSKEIMAIHTPHGFITTSLKRKKQRVWTLNRSPHGNKTAREQFGRQVWQRQIHTQVSMSTAEEMTSRLKRRRDKRVEKRHYVERKEIEKGLI